MNKNFVEIEYKIHFDAPFHFGTGLPNGLIDRGVARDADGYLYIPGSTIKGVLREKCEQLAQLFDLDEVVSPHDEQNAWAGIHRLSIVDQVFGNRFNPGEIYFENAVMSDKWKKSLKDYKQKSMHFQIETRTQTSVSRILGTAREKALYQSEFGVKDLTFNGSIYGQLSGIQVSGDLLYPTVLLVISLYFFQRIGANKSTGMGKFLIEVASLKINCKNQQIENIIGYIEDFGLYRELREEETN